MLALSLSEQHDRKGFDCGDASLNGRLKQTAKQHREKGISSTFVAVADEISSEMLGFYAISLAELVNADLPVAYGRRLPNKVPVFRLGRLATDLGYQRKGVGGFLLFDAINRVTQIAQEVGGIGLVVNAKHAAREFYQQYGFEPMFDHPQSLFLSF